MLFSISSLKMLHRRYDWIQQIIGMVHMVNDQSDQHPRQFMKCPITGKKESSMIMWVSENGGTPIDNWMFYDLQWKSQKIERCVGTPILRNPHLGVHEHIGNAET